MTMKKYVKFVGVMVAAFGAAAAFAGGRNGGWDTGGGMAVVYGPKDIRFGDLVHRSKLPARPYDSELLNQELFGKERFVRVMGSHDFDIRAFWAPALVRLRANSGEFPVFNILAQTLENRHFYRVGLKSRIHFNGDTQDAAGNTRLPIEFQEPVAFFHHGWLIVSEPIYSRMKARHREASAVHESLRYLNSMIDTRLSTSDIEVITRYLMNASFKEDDVQSSLKRLKDSTHSMVKGFDATVANRRASEDSLEQKMSELSEKMRHAGGDEFASMQKEYLEMYRELDDLQLKTKNFDFRESASPDLYGPVGEFRRQLLVLKHVKNYSFDLIKMSQIDIEALVYQVNQDPKVLSEQASGPGN